MPGFGSRFRIFPALAISCSPSYPNGCVAFVRGRTASRRSAIPTCAPLKYIIPSKNQPTSPHPETPGHARRSLMPKKKFKDLTEREILALAIQLEEEDSRVYADFADGLRETYPAPPKSSRTCRPRNPATARASSKCTASASASTFPLIRRAGRERLRRAPSRLARPAARHADRPQAGGSDGTGNAAASTSAP